MDLGYHASHEQFSPAELLGFVEHAADRGFDGVLASDHFHPWSERQGESGHVWSWLGAAMHATDCPFATVNAPGYRYHPAIIAQASATLVSMYPGRFQLAIGSGQLLNEGITGTEWPTKPERNERLRECASVMRALWAGEEVTHHGRVTVEQATLYSRPDDPPPLIGAALTVDTARWLGEWADGMITIGTPDHDGDAERVEAFREVAPDKPVYLKVQLAYGDDDEAVRADAHDQWSTNCIPSTATQVFRTPADYDELAALVDESTVTEHVRVSADPADHIEWLQHDADLDADGLYLHNVTTDQQRFIDDFAEEVLPALR